MLASAPGYPTFRQVTQRCLFAFFCFLGWIAQLAESQSCEAIIDPITTHSGHSLLQECHKVATLSAEAAALGQAEPQPEYTALCSSVALRLLDESLQGDGICLGCPEVCVLVLVLLGGPALLDGTAQCSQTLLLLVKAYRALDKLPEITWLARLYDSLPAMVHARRIACAKTRQQELARLTLPGLAGDAAVRSPTAIDASSGNLQQSLDQVAILVAATPNMLHLYQPFINIWRCYAMRHGFAFILETDDTEVSLPHRRAANWMRWFAVRKYIEFYKAILIVEPDQFVVPECWNYSLPAVLGVPHSNGHEPVPDVATRDFGAPQTLNNGMVLIRSSPRGVFFLDQLLEKASWMQTIEKDQGCFDETMLEILGLEDRDESIGGLETRGYNSECAQFLFPNARGNHEVALYDQCWWPQAERLAGPFGERRSRTIRLVDPRITDVNHVVGARDLEPALVHHFAGKTKNWDAMLSTFGLSKRQTADCRQVLAHTEKATEQQRCYAGAPVAQCEDGLLVC